MRDDTGKSSPGFFSRVLDMVRGKEAPAQASALAPTSISGSNSEPAAAAVDSRRELRATARRKRHNDAIRHKEFAALRQLRQQSLSAPDAEAATGKGGAQAGAEQAGGLSSPSDWAEDQKSAQTLHKIDAIEAQMSRQWWGEEPLDSLPSLSSRKARESVLPEEASAAEGGAAASGPIQASVEFQPVPELDEVAILFAHGDLAGAQARLLELLAQSLSAQPVQQELVAALWHAALDWCRATGDEAGFESLAIDYATHFEKSAPMWVSVPHLLGMPPLVASAAAPEARPVREFQWSSPATLTMQAVTALQNAHDKAASPWSLSWQRLHTVAPEAAAPLAHLLETWADQPGQFVCSHGDRLLALVEQHTPEGDAQADPAWWLLRLAVLRLMQRMADYEQVALDYCTTYEISPPAWQAPVCQCLDGEEGDPSVLQDSHLLSGFGQAEAAGPDMAEGLRGVVEGDIQERMQPLTAGLGTGQPLDVDCSQLIRLDFIAAGGLLNWAADWQAKGHTLRFVHLHHLVAAFLHMLGMAQHAQLMLRA